MSYDFHVHHVFTQQLFDNRDLVTWLNSALAGGPAIQRDMLGNEIALFTDPAQAAAVQAAIANGNTLFTDAGFGGSPHGVHPGYNQFLLDAFNDLMTSNLSATELRGPIYNLHRFATQVSLGQARELSGNGSYLNVTASAADLTAAWNAASLNTTGLTEYVTSLGSSAAQQALDPNSNAAREHFADMLHASATGERNPANAVIDPDTASTLLGGSRWEVTQAVREISHAIFEETGIGANNATTQLQNLAGLAVVATGGALFVAGGVPPNDPGVLNASYDSLMLAIGGIGYQLDRAGSHLPASLDALGAGVVNNLSSVVAGVGGGLIGDTAEFLNMAYDSIKTGIETGDWSGLAANVATFGAAAVFTAVAVTGSVAVASAAVLAAGGTAAAAATVASVVAAGWAAYGIYDGFTNIIELVGKIADDSGYWMDQISDLFEAFSITAPNGDELLALLPQGGASGSLGYVIDSAGALSEAIIVNTATSIYDTIHAVSDFIQNAFGSSNGGVNSGAVGGGTGSGGSTGGTGVPSVPVPIIPNIPEQIIEIGPISSNGVSYLGGPLDLTATSNGSNTSYEVADASGHVLGEVAVASDASTGATAVATMVNGDGQSAPEISVSTSVRNNEGGWEPIVLRDGGAMAAGHIGSVLGSALGQAIDTGNAFADIAAGTVLSTVLQNVGESIGFYLQNDISLSDAVFAAIENVHVDLAAGLLSAGVGAISSFLMGELAESLGLDGVSLGDQILTTTTGSLAQAAINNALQGHHVFQGFAFEGATIGPAGVNLAVGISSLVGGYIAREIVAPETLAGSIGGAIGGGLGTVVGAGLAAAPLAALAGGATLIGSIGSTVVSTLGLGSLALASTSLVMGVLLPGVGALLGTLLGTVIGNAFEGWGDDHGYGSSVSTLAIGADRFAVTSQSGDDADFMEPAFAIGDVGTEILNEILARIGGSNASASATTFVVNVENRAEGPADSNSVRYDNIVVYGHGLLDGAGGVATKGPSGDAFVRDVQGTDPSYRIATLVLEAVARLEIAGGDLYMRRALANTEADTLEALMGDLRIAEDYTRYLANRAIIDALIALEPESAFAAGWAITLLRAEELGLNRLNAVDFNGGLAGFALSIDPLRPQLARAANDDEPWPVWCAVA